MEPHKARAPYQYPNSPVAGGRLPRSLAIIANQAFSLINFRGALIRDLVASGVRVYALAPDFTDESRVQVGRLGGEPVGYRFERVGVNPLRDGIDTLGLVFVLRRLKPEAVLTYFIKPVILGTIAAWLAGIPSRVAMIEGLGFVFMEDPSARSLRRRILRRVVERLFAFALRKAERVVLLNQDDVSDLCRAGGLERSKAVLVPGIGVDLTYFAPCPQVTDPPTFVFVARMLREKGVIEFVQAAMIVRRRYPESRFVLVGGTDANPGAVSEALLSRWHNEGAVEWLGHVSDIRQVIAEASVFVLPSYREGLPRSTQEAMAMARPVITTNVPGCRETVIDGTNGFLVPPRDSASLARAMVRFIEDPSLVVKMGAESRRMAEALFDQAKANRALMAVLAAH